MSLDYKLKLNMESEHKSLYKWGIDEIDEEGKIVNEKLIPWGWGVNFKTKNISYKPSYELRKKREYDEDEDRMLFMGEHKGEHRIDEIEAIHGELEVDGDAIIQMFGTNRHVRCFNLNIGVGEKGLCYLFGSPQYTTEIDFRDTTSPDFVELYIRLSEKKFRELSQMIIAKSLTSVFIRVSGVSGFYSRWSPSVETDSIKVLTKHHEVEIPEGCDIEPPITGQVNNLRMILEMKQEFGLTQQVDSEIVDEDEVLDEDEFDETFDNTSQISRSRSETLQEQTRNELLVLQKIVKRLLWVIIIMLGILLLNS